MKTEDAQIIGRLAYHNKKKELEADFNIILVDSELFMIMPEDNFDLNKSIIISPEVFLERYESVRKSKEFTIQIDLEKKQIKEVEKLLVLDQL